jgi:hypothetical protein
LRPAQAKKVRPLLNRKNPGDVAVICHPSWRSVRLKYHGPGWTRQKVKLRWYSTCLASKSSNSSTTRGKK